MNYINYLNSFENIHIYGPVHQQGNPSKDIAYIYFTDKSLLGIKAETKRTVGGIEEAFVCSLTFDPDYRKMEGIKDRIQIWLQANSSSDVKTRFAAKDLKSIGLWNHDETFSGTTQTLVYDAPLTEESLKDFLEKKLPRIAETLRGI